MIRIYSHKALADKSWVDEIVMSENSPSADYNFGNIYIWDKHLPPACLPAAGTGC